MNQNSTFATRGIIRICLTRPHILAFLTLGHLQIDYGVTVNLYSLKSNSSVHIYCEMSTPRS